MENEAEYLGIYSMYDRKLREFGALAVAKNDAAIVRAVVDGVPGTNSMVARHPEDFDVMKLGQYSPLSGFVAPVEGPPVLVANVADILRSIGNASD